MEIKAIQSKINECVEKDPGAFEEEAMIISVDDDDGDEDEGVQGFTRRWNLLILVDEVSELSKYNWEQVFNMDVGEMMTWCCYGRDKAKNNEEQRKQWQRKYERNY